MSHPEALLISAVLRTGDHLTPLQGGITKQLFHVHQTEWGWIEKHITRHGKPPSKNTFKIKFPDFSVKKADDVGAYVDEVKEAHARYVLTDLIDKAVTLIDQDELTEAVNALHSGVIEVQSQLEGESGDFNFNKDWNSVYQEVAKRQDRVLERGMAGIPTGFDTLDNLTSGPQPGDFWVVAARLGMGKTWTLVRMATGALCSGYTVQYNALEQNRHQIAFRFHSFMSSRYGQKVFKSLDLMKGKGFNLKDYKEFLEVLEKDMPGTLYINDTSRGRLSPLTIAAQIERYHPDVIFIDYLTLMDSGDSWRDTAKLSAEMKQMAQRYEVPIVVAAQINRTGAGKEPPRAEHIGMSDAIGQDADCVVTMAQQSKHVMKFRLAKYRHGQDGDIFYCDFSPNSGRFEEVSGDRAQELMDQDNEESE